MNYSHQHSLTLKSLIGLTKLLGTLAIGLFLPNGSLHFWQAWAYILIFALSCILITLYFLKNDPKLIERRLQAGPTAEKEKTQKIIQSVAGILFLALYVIASFDHRFHWSSVSNLIVRISEVLVIIGFEVIFLTFRENSFASSIIELGKDQHVISTGPYRVVRHPMYLGAIILLLASAPALGSWWAIIPGIFLSITIVARLTAEENFLVANLPGYKEYQQKVRSKLIPRIW